METKLTVLPQANTQMDPEGTVAATIEKYLKFAKPLRESTTHSVRLKFVSDSNVCFWLNKSR